MLYSSCVSFTIATGISSIGPPRAEKLFKGFIWAAILNSGVIFHIFNIFTALGSLIELIPFAVSQVIMKIHPHETLNLMVETCFSNSPLVLLVMKIRNYFWWVPKLVIQWHIVNFQFLEAGPSRNSIWNIFWCSTPYLIAVSLSKFPFPSVT